MLKKGENCSPAKLNNYFLTLTYSLITNYLCFVNNNEMLTSLFKRATITFL